MLSDSSKPNPPDHRVFLSFYDQYAPKLWGLILRADLPVAQSETILTATFLKAWQHPHRQTIGQHQQLSWLLSLACEEGFPPGTLKAVFR